MPVEFNLYSGFKICMDATGGGRPKDKKETTAELVERIKRDHPGPRVVVYNPPPPPVIQPAQRPSNEPRGKRESKHTDAED